MTNKTLDQWLEEYKQARIEYLKELRKELDDFQDLFVLEYGKYTQRAELNGVVYKTYEGQLYLSAKLRHQVSQADFNTIIFKDITESVDKEVEVKRKDLLKKVTKYCGEELVIQYDEEYMMIVKGTIGRAKILKVVAGGYNVQCLHIRILVKGLK